MSQMKFEIQSDSRTGMGRLRHLQNLADLQRCSHWCESSMFRDKGQCGSWMSHACEHKDVPVIWFVLVEKAQQLKLGVTEA